MRAPDRNISDPMLLTHNMMDPSSTAPTRYEFDQTNQAQKLMKSIDVEPGHFFYRKNEEWPLYVYEVI